MKGGSGSHAVASCDGGRVEPDRRNGGGAKTPDDNILDTRPTGTITAILSPPWWVDIAAAKNGSIVQVHHPEYGWLAFVFPPE